MTTFFRHYNEIENDELSENKCARHTRDDSYISLKEKLRKAE